MNVLVVALDNLGDVVMASSLARVLHAEVPGSRVYFWVKDYSAPVLEACPEVDGVFRTNPFWEDSKLHPKGSVAGMVRTIRALRRQDFEAALVLNAEWRRAGFSWLAGIPHRFGLNQRKSRFFLTHKVCREAGIVPQPRTIGSQARDIPDALHKTVHILEEHTRVLEAFLGRSVEPLVPRLKISSRQEKVAQSFFEANSFSGSNVLVGIHPFCGNSVRRWPSARFVELCERLLSRPEVRIIGFCGSWERQGFDAWRSRLGQRFVLTPESFGLSENIAVLSGCHAFVGLDSGLSHASAALGVPTLALFGPSSPERFSPVGPGLVRVLRRDPLEELQISEVLAEFQALLGQRHPQRTPLFG